MNYFIGLIPKKSSNLRLQKLRSDIAKYYGVDDYRKNVILHVTVSYLFASNIKQIYSLIDKNPIKLVPTTLETIALQYWDDKKISLLFANQNIPELILQLEQITGIYNINSKYRTQVTKFYKTGEEKEYIGDHMKIIRNVNAKDWDAIQNDDRITFPKDITFTKLAIFNSDYSKVLNID